MWQKDKTIVKETNSRLLTGTEAVINIVNRIFYITGIVVLVMMMLMTVSDVFARYVFNKPILGTAELIQFMMVTLAFLAMVVITGVRGHIKVDLLSKYLPPMVKTSTEGIYSFFGIIIFALISWQNFIQVNEMQRTSRYSNLLDIPYSPFYFILAVSCGLIAMILLLNMIQCIIRVVERWK